MTITIINNDIYIYIYNAQSSLQYFRVNVIFYVLAFWLVTDGFSVMEKAPFPTGVPSNGVHC